MQNASFRKDINGLRALAVVAVILYHFRVPGFGGGFAGVDVFFVISGFLMVGIVLRGLQAGNFSLAGFYMGRVRRIVPALFALCAVLLLLGWLVLLPPDYKRLGTHSAYALSFLSNVEYWLEAGYFDQESHQKWLLHTWSLAVEWQFYLLLPVLMLAAWKLRPGFAAQRWILGAVAAFSLAASIFVSHSDPSGAFFLLHTRAWEMLAGGLLCLLPSASSLSQRQRAVLEGIGLIVIIASLVVFSHLSVWPGWRATVPVAGALMILFANRASVWTGNAAAQWIGDRSYSLYLWHWPVYVALVYVEAEDGLPAIMFGVAVSFVLGALSYRWIEQPARRALARQRDWTAAAAVAAATVLVALPAVAIWHLQGVPGRFSPKVVLAAAEAENINARRNECHREGGAASPSCVFGGPEWKVVLVGDSHAGAIVSAVAGAKQDGGAGVVQWSYSGCLFVPDMKQVNPHQFGKDNDCEGFNAWVSRQMRELPPSIPAVIVGRYARSAFGPLERKVVPAPEVYFASGRHLAATPAFIEEFSRHIVDSACTLAKQRTVFMVRPLPEMPVHVPRYMSRRMAWGLDADVSVSMAEYMARNGWVWKAQDAARDRCGIRILDPLPLLCRDGRCYASKDDRPIYYDHGHLSEFGNQLLKPIFREVFESLEAGQPVTGPGQSAALMR